MVFSVMEKNKARQKRYKIQGRSCYFINLLMVRKAPQ